MGVWNSENDDNELARLLSMALPHIDTDEELLKLSPEQLVTLNMYCDSVTDNLLSQQGAIADLLANADLGAAGHDVVRNASWAIRELVQVAEFFRRFADTASAYRTPEMRALFESQAHTAQ